MTKWKYDQSLCDVQPEAKLFLVILWFAVYSGFYQDLPVAAALPTVRAGVGLRSTLVQFPAEISFTILTIASTTDASHPRRPYLATKGWKICPAPVCTLFCSSGVLLQPQPGILRSAHMIVPSTHPWYCPHWKSFLTIHYFPKGPCHPVLKNIKR